MKINDYINWDNLFNVIINKQDYLHCGKGKLPIMKNDFYDVFHSDEYKKMNLYFDDCCIDDNIIKVVMGYHDSVHDSIIYLTIHFKLPTCNLVFIDMNMERV